MRPLVRNGCNVAGHIPYLLIRVGARCALSAIDADRTDKYRLQVISPML